MASNQIKYYDNPDLYNIISIQDNPFDFELSIEKKNKLYSSGAYSIKNIIINRIYNKIKKRLYFNKLLNS